MRRVNGEGSWDKIIINGRTYIRFSKTYNGKRKQFTGASIKDVKKKVSEYEAKLNCKEDNKDISFYLYAYTWLHEEHKDKIKEKTFSYYDMFLRTSVYRSKLGLITIGELNKDQIKTEQLFEAHLKEYAKTHSKSSTDGLYTLFKLVCAYGYKRHDFAYNFILNVDRVSEKNAGHKTKEICVLTYDQLLIFWNECGRTNNSDNYINGSLGSDVYGINACALKFISMTGLRVGELQALTWNDVDMNNKTMNILKQILTYSENGKTVRKVSDPKRNSKRVIILPDNAIILLKEVQQKYGKRNYIFGTVNGLPCDSSNLNKTLKRICARAGLPETTVHGLRHSFASAILNKDKNQLYAVSKLLGHSSPLITERVYLSIDEDKISEAINVFNNL